MVPFNKPFLSGDELRYMREAIELGHISGGGPFTQRCSQLISERTGSAAALLTPSCTHALELAARLIGVGPGDEVIVPSFTFVSTANAFALQGARPVFADIRSDTLNIDDRLLEPLITSRTRAIAVVHYGGVACEMDPILKVAASHGLTVVEDNAHGFGGRYQGAPLGSSAPLATLSFHETKSIQCGEGGALLVNDPNLVERAEVLRDKGTNRSQFLRGEVDKYTWVDVGSSWVLSDLLAAYLCAQLERAEEIIRARRRLWDRYHAGLEAWAAEVGARLPDRELHRDAPAHLFYVLVPRASDRDPFISHLREHGVHAVFHYVPLHSSPQGGAMRGTTSALPVTDDVSSRLVRLPLFPELTDQDQERVLTAVRSYRPESR
ncbi:MAG: DegT/DnrJ/EryC1/StrS aminotransferase [Acidimicrobiales bacterium]|nr:DegT/DnrJ/EryC1/StrS aminotransferase [Acidimicrobiales bacterium]